MDTANQSSNRTTSLQRNAFLLLGVTTRDDRRKIVERAEERALHFDQAECQKARSDLTNPRTRLAVELAWLPGVSPRTAETLIEKLRGDPLATALQKGIPELARANLMAAALELSEPDGGPASTTADFMRIFGEVVDRLDPVAILRDINEDRAVAQFSEVRDTTVVVEELDTLRKHYKSVLKGALDAMQSVKLVETMTLLAERSTQSGTKAAPAIIDDLVDSYAVETQGFLDREEQNLSSLINSARTAAHSGGSVKPVLDKLEQVSRNWTRVAKPIQLSMMARGMAHQKSQALAYAMRGLGIDLFNEHNLIADAERMTSLLRELFAEVGDVAERLGEDAKALQDIARKNAFSAVLGPLRALCKEAAEKADSAPSTADRQAIGLASAAPGHLTQFEKSGVPEDLLAQMSDEVAQAIVYCAIAFGNETSQWSRSVELLSSAKRFAFEPKTKERISENLRIVERNTAMYGNTTPIKSAPSLSTINGFGFTLYGCTDLDVESGSHMATYYFVALFIPIFPICRYRVISTGGNSYRFLGKGPLRTFDKVHLAISIGLIVLMLLK